MKTDARADWRMDTKLLMSDERVALLDSYNIEIGVLMNRQPYPVEIAWPSGNNGPMNPTFSIEEATALRDALSDAIVAAKAGRGQ